MARVLDGISCSIDRQGRLQIILEYELNYNMTRIKKRRRYERLAATSQLSLW